MSANRSFWLTPKGLAALGLIGATTSYFLLMEHSQHLFELLPFLILLLCPVMHLFMHGGHGGDHNHTNEDVDLDDYRKGYEDALRDSKNKNKIEENKNAW